MSQDFSIRSKVERIEQVELESAFGQLKKAYAKIRDIEKDIDDLYERLKTKVNLQSLVSEKETYNMYVGEGVVTISAGTNKVTGTGTSFLKRFAVGNRIKIGSATGVVKTIQSDIELTLEDALTPGHDNSIYAIVVPTMADELTGYYRFGGAQGKQFRGVVAEGSVLEHYGRVSMPNDVATVRAVQKYVQPAMTLAQNSIRRSGDTVGNLESSSEDVLKFKFYGTDFQIGGASGLDSTIRWAASPGPAYPKNIEADDDKLTNKKYVDDGLQDAREDLALMIIPVIAFWDHLPPTGKLFTCNDYAYTNYLADGVEPSRGSTGKDGELLYKQFFDATGCCKKRCAVGVTYGAWAVRDSHNHGSNILPIEPRHRALNTVIAVGKSADSLIALRRMNDGGWASDQHHSKKMLVSSVNTYYLFEKGEYLLCGHIVTHAEDVARASLSIIVWDSPVITENLNAATPK